MTHHDLEAPPSLDQDHGRSGSDTNLLSRCITAPGNLNYNFSAVTTFAGMVVLFLLTALYVLTESATLEAAIDTGAASVIERPCKTRPRVDVTKPVEEMSPKQLSTFALQTYSDSGSRAGQTNTGDETDVQYVVATIDSRPNALLRVMGQITQYLDRRWNIRVVLLMDSYVYEDFRELVLEIQSQEWYTVAVAKVNRVFIHRLHVHDTPNDMLANMVLTDPDFYRLVAEPRILLVQEDTAICARSPHATPDGLIHFMDKYDWIGAPYGSTIAGEPDMQCCNGALAVRSRELMLNCFAKYPHSLHAAPPWFSEDAYISRCLKREQEDAQRHNTTFLWRSTLPTPTEAMTFASSDLFAVGSLGLHNPCMHHCEDTAWQDWLRYCPEAIDIMLHDHRSVQSGHFCTPECAPILRKIAEEQGYELHKYPPYRNRLNSTGTRTRG